MIVQFLLLLLSVLTVSVSLSEKFSLTEDYSVEVLPPTAEDSPVELQASVNLRNILDVVETKQQISLEITLRYYWRDLRITPAVEHLNEEDSYGGYVNLHPDETKKIWMPDTFIDQAINLRKPTYFLAPHSLRLYNDSTVRYSTRINFDVACGMDFHKFPWDQQICKVKFESFSYSNNQISMRWLNMSMSQVNPDIRLDQFHHSVDFHDNYSTDIYDISYPGIIMKITLTRNIGYHVMQTFIPSTLFVILGYLSLYIPAGAVPGRVAMGMTTILTLTAMFGAIRHTVPKVSYVSFLDIWMVTCIVFVNLFMFEYVLVIFIKDNGNEKLSREVEARCRVLLPVCFLAFNTLYWPIVHTV